MPFDAGFMRAVTVEANAALAGGHIDRVTQPGRDIVTLSLSVQRKSAVLLLDAGANPKLTLAPQAPEAPSSPPMFCMLLRKHLSGGRIAAIEQAGFERVARARVDAVDEMGFEVRRNLYLEILGKHSAIILTDGEDRIIAATRQTDLSAGGRQLLPGFTYELPPDQGKRDPLGMDPSQLRALFEAAAPDTRADKYISSALMGISPFVARELVLRCGFDADATAGECGAGRLASECAKLAESINAGRFEPCIFTDTASGAMLEFSYTPSSQYGAAARPDRFESPSACVYGFYRARDEAEHVRQRTGELQKQIKAARTRLAAREAAWQAELTQCAGRDQLRLFGELLTANLHALRRGMASAEIIDYYSEDASTVSIPLEPTLYPAQNAQRYFKRYSKLKAAEGHLTRLLESARLEALYIDSVADSLSRAVSERDIAEIRTEWQLQYGKKPPEQKRGGKKPPKRPPVAQPLKYAAPGGYTILVGRNNRGNDELTFRLADKTDWWFHVKNMPGSHVILLCGGREPEPAALERAARLAALHSRAGTAPNTAVDYTQVRHVKKPPGSPPGYVTYDRFKTAYVAGKDN